MTDYQLTATPTVIRTRDGAYIPSDPANRDRAEYDAWVAAGGIADPYVQPQPVPPSFLARDLFALLTVDDFTAIVASTSKSPALGLLWASLQAQGEAPIHPTTARFLAGWAGLRQALGDVRASALAGALGIPDA
jgi:hypothetical protein